MKRRTQREMSVATVCIRVVVVVLALICFGSLASALPVASGTGEKVEKSEAGEMPGNHERTGEEQTTPPASSVLQVTGTTNSFNISAQHADVQTVLKLVFEQAHRQFVPDASVSGDVTLYLTNQRFDTVLASICKQVLLRADVDKNGIYQIRRDNEALLNLIQRTRYINALLAEQLRSMGFEVPTLRYNGPSQSGAVSPSAQTGGGGRGRTGEAAKDANNRVFGGPAGASGPAGPSGPPGTAEAEDASKGKVPGAGGFGGGGASNRPEKALPADAKQAGSRSDGLSADRPGARGGAAVPLDKASPNLALVNPQRGTPADVNAMMNLDDPAQYQAFLKQFRLVSIDTKGMELSVRDLLQDIGKQAGIGVYIDPSVPTGKDFVLRGIIPPRPLADLLSILCYNAQLDWRLVNGHIFITATPQFGLRLNNGIPLSQTPGVTVLPSKPATKKPSDKKTEGDNAGKDKQ